MQVWSRGNPFIFASTDTTEMDQRMCSKLSLLFVLLPAVATWGCGDPRAADDDTAELADTTIDLDTATTGEDGGEGTVDAGATPDGAALDVVCEPSCGERVCGPNGCGGLCGVCKTGEKCELGGTCTPICTKKADTRCIDGDVYWLNSCDEVEELAETCPEGTFCAAGACEPCTPKDTLGCEGSNRVVWLDSCGFAGELVQECGGDLICAKGSCVPPSHPWSGDYVVSVSSTTASVLVEGVEVTSVFDAIEAAVAIDGFGAATITLIGGDTWDGRSGVGALDGDVLQLAFEAESAQGTQTVIRKLQAQLLHQGSVGGAGFAGTLRELLFIDDELDPPKIVERDFTLTPKSAQ
jgi:hypothetical protein